MIMQNQILNDIDTDLRPYELALKSAWECCPDRHLDEPHTLDEIRDVLDETTAKCPNLFAEKLIQQRLEEDLFFAGSSNVEIYHHLRYLPTYWHSHDFIEIACVLNGSCVNYIAEQKIIMETGDICIIAPQTRHAISAFSDECMMFNYIIRTSTFEDAFFGVLNENDILSDFFMRILYGRSSHPYLLFRTGMDEELFSYAGYSLQEFDHNRQYKNLMLSSIINLFFITLLRNHSTDVIISEKDSKQENENTVLILKYIQEHYSTVTLSELSGFFNYSERQIQRIIKDSTGISFSQNIQKIRLRQAVRLMQNPNLSITAISEELGYAAPENFRHIFKKYYGMTPMEYRSEHSGQSGI
ncbi:MAG: AraC family transcriptional regulator [Clostridiales bacterium]|nr:AraC family transcriptional regulator [Clostridiales bacterium]